MRRRVARTGVNTSWTRLRENAVPTVITRTLEFVKVDEVGIDWERRSSTFSYLKRTPMRPHSSFLTVLPAALTLLATGPASAQRPAAAPKIDSLLARMTLE